MLVHNYLFLCHAHELVVLLVTYPLFVMVKLVKALLELLLFLFPCSPEVLLVHSAAYFWQLDGGVGYYRRLFKFFLVLLDFLGVFPPESVVLLRVNYLFIMAAYHSLFFLCCCLSGVKFIVIFLRPLLMLELGLYFIYFRKFIHVGDIQDTLTA